MGSSICWPTTNGNSGKKNQTKKQNTPQPTQKLPRYKVYSSDDTFIPPAGFSVTQSLKDLCVTVLKVAFLSLTGAGKEIRRQVKSKQFVNCKVYCKGAGHTVSSRSAPLPKFPYASLLRRWLQINSWDICYLFSHPRQTKPMTVSAWRAFTRPKGLKHPTIAITAKTTEDDCAESLKTLIRSQNSSHC